MRSEASKLRQAAALKAKRGAMSLAERRTARSKMTEASRLKKNAAERALYAAMSPAERTARARRGTEATKLRISLMSSAEQETRRLKKNAAQNAKYAAMSPDERRAVRARRSEASRLKRNARQNAKRAAMSLDERRVMDARGRAARSKASRSKKNAYERNRYKQLRDFVSGLKKAPCLDCRVCYPPYVMDFDHRPDGTKAIAVGNMLHASTERILEEVSKCDLVCSNCHRERTHRRRVQPVSKSATRYARQHALLSAYKNAPCLDCRVCYPPYVMDFDHRPGEKKTKAVAQLSQGSLAALLVEIAKCDLVCSNCHRERTHRRRSRG